MPLSKKDGTSIMVKEAMAPALIKRVSMWPEKGPLTMRDSPEGAVFTRLSCYIYHKEKTRRVISMLFIFNLLQVLPRLGLQESC